MNTHKIIVTVVAQKNVTEEEIATAIDNGLGGYGGIDDWTITDTQGGSLLE